MNIGNLATVFTLLILMLVACFGYYQGFVTLATRNASLNHPKQVKGGRAIALGLLYVVAAVASSAVAVLFYFSL